MASAPIHAFLEFFKPVPCTTFFPSYWQLSHITIVETMDSGESGMNPVALTIIDHRKEYWPSRGSNQRPVLKSATLQTAMGLGNEPKKAWSAIEKIFVTCISSFSMFSTFFYLISRYFVVCNVHHGNGS